MAKSLANAVLDAALNEISDSIRLVVCSGAPANYGGIAAVALADATLASGDFTIADAPGGGRQVTVSAQTDFPVDASGTATHISLDDGAVLLLVTEVNPTQALVNGNTVSTSAFNATFPDPV